MSVWRHSLHCCLPSSWEAEFSQTPQYTCPRTSKGRSTNLLPPQGAPTIGDRLSAKGVNWAWYSGGWELATKAYRTEAEDAEFERLEFQYHHQPFAYYERFNPLRQGGRDERAKHLKDEAIEK